MMPRTKTALQALRAGIAPRVLTTELLCAWFNDSLRPAASTCHASISSSPTISDPARPAVPKHEPTPSHSTHATTSRPPSPHHTLLHRHPALPNPWHQHGGGGHSLRSLHTSHPACMTASRHVQYDAVPPSSRSRAETDESQRAAQEVMDDPMSRLLASRGMPLGMSFVPLSRTGDKAEPPPPPYSMEALDEILATTRRDAATKEEEARVAGASGGGEGGEAVGARDSWGTTRESAGEIARRIAHSNAGSGDSLEAELEDAAAALHGGPGELDDLTLSLDEAKYKTLESMSKDIKDLDEVFEVLASVPWLDEAAVDQKELKGMAQVALLGTLEEVGFAISTQVRRIWAGERDHNLVLEGQSAKDQAALISVLFHTKLIEDQYGPPPALE